MRLLMVLALLAILVPGLAAAQEDADSVAIVVAGLEAGLKSDDDIEQVEAIRQAAGLKEPAVVKLVARYIWIRKRAVVAEAVDTLGKMDHPDALKVLHSAYWKAKTAGLPKRDDLLFARLLKAIGRHGSESSLRVLTDSPFKNVTAATGTARIMALGNIRSKKTVEAIIKGTKKAGAYSARSANFTDFQGLFDTPFQVTMTVLTGHDYGSARSTWQKWWSGQEAKKFKMSPERPKVPAEISEFWERYWDEPYYPEGKEPASGGMGSPFGRTENPTPERVKQAVEDIRAALRGKDGDAKIAALEANADVIDAKVVRAMGRGLIDRDPAVRMATVGVLGWMKHKEGLKLLHRLYRRAKDLHRQEELFAHLLKAIGRHGDKSSLRVLGSDPYKGLTIASGRARILGISRIHNQDALVSLMKGLRLTGRHPLDIRAAEPRFADSFRVAFVTLTGQDLGMAKEAWEAWWQKNRRKFKVAQGWPSVPADVQRYWENYWEEPYGEG